MILAIDTATQFAGLALFNQDGVFAEETWFSGRNHTVELMPRIVRMLDLARLNVSQLTALAVALGPGSFTGLRIGLAAAKGLALPYKLPVVGVPTLEIVARPFSRGHRPVWTVVQAGRGRIFAACYARLDNTWQPVVKPYLTNFDELIQQITEPALCTGEIDHDAEQLLLQNAKVQVVAPAIRPRRAACLAEIAVERLAAGEQDDPDALVPIYLSYP